MRPAFAPGWLVVVDAPFDLDSDLPGGLAGSLRRGEPLSRHTYWALGGAAELFYEPKNVAELARLLAELPESLPVFFLGLGSNVLVRDGGIDGLVVHTANCLGALEPLGELELRVGAGVPCAKLARVCQERGLAGAAWFAGIPGTLGGALAMNAGCFGGETWEHVVEVELLDRRGRRSRRSASDFDVGYRHCGLPEGHWFTAARLRFEAGDRAEIEQRVRELLRRRGESQPTGVRSCGSVFKNPPGDHAARLIDSTGLKGLRRGGAEVSVKHANFIVHRGDASAADVEALIGAVRNAVEQRHGVRLEPEVRIVGKEGTA